MTYIFREGAQMYSGRRYYFITIAETLNITRAAERLMVSQPSLTQYLNKLESDLEIKLVDRSFTPLRLTEAGKLYYDYLVKQREAEDALNASLQRLRSKGRRPLMRGIPLQKSHEIISRLLPNFSKEHPDIEVSIWEGTSSTVRERVLRGELDIGFGHIMDEVYENCVVEYLNEEKLLIICHRDNPIVHGCATSESSTLLVGPEALSSQHFFQMSEEYYLCEVETRHLESHGVRPYSRTVMSNLHAIISSIIASPNSGFAYMPDYVLKETWPSSVRDQLAYIRLDAQDIAWHFSMMRRRGQPLTPSAKLFWKSVVEANRSKG